MFIGPHSIGVAETLEQDHLVEREFEGVDSVDEKPNFDSISNNIKLDEGVYAEIYMDEEEETSAKMKPSPEIINPWQESHLAGTCTQGKVFSICETLVIEIDNIESRECLFAIDSYQ